MAEQGVKVPGLRHRWLALLAMVGLGASVAAFTLDAPEPAGVANGVSLAREAEAIVRIADGVTRGAIPDFETLRRSSEQFDSAAGGRAAGTALAAVWAQIRPSVQTMLAQAPAWQRAYENVQLIARAVHAGKPGQDDHGLAADDQALLDKLVQANAGTAPLLLASAQLVALERISAGAQRVLLDGLQAPQAAAALPTLVESLKHNDEALFADAKLVTPEEAKALTDRVQAIADAVDKLQQDAPAIGQLMLAAAQVTASPPGLVAAAMNAAPGHGSQGRLLGTGAATLAAFALLGFVLLNRRLAAAAPAPVPPAQPLAEPIAAPTVQDPQQQEAILKLLDEITNLANGDLTVDMTVTEDFTGAIADSINYTVQTLRSLVGTINQTSGQITASAASTQDVAARLSAASDSQAQQVAATAETISGSAQSLLDVAARAERMAVEAQNSVQVAHKGAATVGRTIQNMAALREQIQDTAKRIKRLGESSQEVGSITEVINDLAEQTNTLALNASIQAKNAGEQSRGFALIADQVQELAERAASATRQIEILVKTIQADTGEAVISMERSTANVVAGATSAEEAGQALTRIEASSQELATSVQTIALSARNQSAEAVKMAGTMQSLRAIASETSASADRTSQAVTELNALADRLRESVAGFKLPG